MKTLKHGNDRQRQAERKHDKYLQGFCDHSIDIDEEFVWRNHGPLTMPIKELWQWAEARKYMITDFSA